MNNFTKKKAFSLVEMLTVCLLAIVIIIGAYSIYIISLKSYRKNSAEAELSQNARIALERMTRDIRQAIEILTPLPPDPGSETPANEIKFQDGHNYWPSGKIQYINYKLVETDLHRILTHYSFGDASDPNWVLYSTLDGDGHSPTEYTDSDQIKAQNVSLLEFWGEETIAIDLEVSDGTITFPFQTKILGRNIQ